MLYGDGIHDDTAGLQALLDERLACVKFPQPKVCYMISAPLKIYSGQELTLDRYCHIKLMSNSNCVMLKNGDPENGDRNIEVTGGIWDLNNMEQAKNPIHFSGNPNLFMGFAPDTYNGTVISFHNVKNLRFAHLTIKDPVTFAISFNIVENFTVEDITFNFNYGNPWAVNMDGIHLCGNCRFGVIRNIKGTCYDDMVALNADEGIPGPISDIQIDGLFADDCHSAVRLLSAEYPVERVVISNVYGTYYQYCIGITKYYDGTNGYFDSIVIKGIFAAKAPRHSVYKKDGTYIYPFIWVQSDLRVKNLNISEVYRKEKNVSVEMIGIDKGATIENLYVCSVVQENLTPGHLPLIVNQGMIENLYVNGLRNDKGDLLINNGTVNNANGINV